MQRSFSSKIVSLLLFFCAEATFSSLWDRVHPPTCSRLRILVCCIQSDQRYVQQLCHLCPVHSPTTSWTITALPYAYFALVTSLSRSFSTHWHGLFSDSGSLKWLLITWSALQHSALSWKWSKQTALWTPWNPAYSHNWQWSPIHFWFVLKHLPLSTSLPT